MATQFEPGIWRSGGDSKCGRANYISADWRRRNKPLGKQSADDIRAWLEAPHRKRIREESDAIRARKGLEPVPDNEIVCGARSRLAELEAKPSKRKAAAPKRELTPAERVSAAAKRRRELEREREALDAEIRELVALAQSDPSISVSGIARSLGLSRQRLYQVAAA